MLVDRPEHTDDKTLGSLTFEQQLKLQILIQDVQEIDDIEQARAFIIELIRHDMHKDNLVAHFLKNA